ncbi:MAG: nitroreductase family protein [Weeksellaceae bacterium]
MNLKQILNFRRSVRVYDTQEPINPEVVKNCLELAILAPNSSNMQLWQFIHVTDKQILDKLAQACFDQSAATTAQQLVVFVTRQDIHRKRAKEVLNFEKQNIRKHSPAARQDKRISDRKKYYGYIMPFIYTKFFGLAGIVRKVLVHIVGLFRPTMYQVSEADMRVVVHKSCALAAQTFMIAMANEGLDTCPMEGYDSRRVKNILSLPRDAEINMIVSCGKRKGNEGIWGERFRVPFDEVYKRL